MNYLQISIVRRDFRNSQGGQALKRLSRRTATRRRARKVFAEAQVPNDRMMSGAVWCCAKFRAVRVASR